MPFFVIQPSTNEQVMAERATEIGEAAARLGMNFDFEGFVRAWVAGTRVVVERNEEGEIISLAFLVAAPRWLENDFPASVLDIKGNREGMLEFIKQIAPAIGCDKLFVGEPEPQIKSPGVRVHTITEISLE